MLGPVFGREATIIPRRPQHYAYRGVYLTALLVLMCTAWLIVAGTQVIRNVGDMARFGSILFQLLAPLQLTLFFFMSALVAASAVAQEKDKRTMILLLLTRMSNFELVVGKLVASLLNVVVMIAAAFPVFLLITLFGGVSFPQVFSTFIVTLSAAVAAGSIGTLVALWREKTFQTLSLTALALVLWLAAGELLNAGVLPDYGSLKMSELAPMVSPLRAVLSTVQPKVTAATFTAETIGFVAFSACLIALVNLIGIWRVRVWNPPQGIRPGQQTEEGSIWSDKSDTDAGQHEEMAEIAREGHVDAKLRAGLVDVPSRRVWDNPVLWRETCTRAYGRKLLVIKLGYILFSLSALAALNWTVQNTDVVAERMSGVRAIVPATAKPLAPFLLLSLVMVNALAVTSITNERDGQALDLLLVTDISPKEFVFGKIGGVMWVTKEMVVLPIAMCCYLWFIGRLTGENLLFMVVGLAVMNFFVAMLGIHCGMSYANSRNAIGVSLGTVFFLFLGVVTCIALLVSFSGSFQGQLAPFLAFILGGGVGLYIALGYRNPSHAILLASLLLPFATFYAITSFILKQEFYVVLVTVMIYGFTTLAMLLPAIDKFDIAIGRTKTVEDE
jgi:ABC-type transport system involved in multi-copper enzyme maturation permease subunit